MIKDCEILSLTNTDILTSKNNFTIYFTIKHIFYLLIKIN